MDDFSNSTAEPARNPGAEKDAKRRDTILLTDVPPASHAGGDSLSAFGSSSTAAVLGQRYDLLSEAGHGSMGNVYKARDRETGEIVALKLLKPEIACDQAMMERFKNELLFARKITHKNVCRVHDFNRIGGVAYTSMEFVEGESLRSVLNRFRSLPVRKGTDLALQVCSGLKEAHAQGIVHRDLKPENVMIDSQGNVKIMDFGIARSMEAATRLTGSMIGTPAYMAPEQVAGKSVDYRTDIYSLGLMLYEMFTGSPAFQAETAVAVALKQMRETPPPPHEVESAIPVAIERIILKCMEKDPAKRFQSIAELEAAFLTGEIPAVTSVAASAAGQLRQPNGTGSRVSSKANIAIAAAIPLAKSKRRQTLVALWGLVVALVLCAVLAGLYAMAVTKSAARIPTPAELPVPKPPDFAFEIPLSPALKADSENSSLAKPKTVNSRNIDVDTKTPEHRKPHLPKSARLDEPKLAPEGVQRRADNAFGESTTTGASNTQKFLWLGRFKREDRAQSAAKKLEDLGLPVMVIPRHGPDGEAFVVITGPYAPRRTESVREWLATQGFSKVHPFALPGAAKAANQ